MKKRFLAAVLAGLMALSLCACGGGNDGGSTASDAGTSSASPSSAGSDAQEETNSSAPAFEGTREVVVGVGADIKTWEPWGAFNLARQNEAPLVYQNLTADIVDLENNTMVHYYVLCESHEEIADLTYRIKIREGIVDSAGNPFTAEDAIFSFETCKEVSTLSQVNLIDHMELVDELTFDMYLTEDTVGSFYDICNAINMVTKESYEASPDGMVSQPIGTAPMVMDEYVSGSYVVFKKADSYWNEAANESKDPDDGYCPMWDLDDIDVVRFETITDSATMAISLESGDIDIARTVSADDVVLFENNDDFTLFEAPDAGMGVAFNASSNSPTQNKNLRLALAYAINSENALIAAADGNGEIATAWSYPAFVDWQAEWDDREYFDYNLDTAKEYLAAWESETGKSASSLSLTLLLQNEDEANAMALSIQSDIAALTGNPNTVTISALDRATFTQAKQDPTQFDLYIVDSQLVTRSHSGYEWNNLVNENKIGYNCFHVTDDELQSKLMDAIQTATTSDATVKAFQDYIDEQCYMKNLCWVNAFGAAASWIGDLDHATGAKSCLCLGALSYDWANSGK